MQKEKIIAALEAEEALIDGLLCDTNVKRCGHAGRCAIGALLYHAGVSNRQIRRLSTDWGTQSVDGFWEVLDPDTGKYVPSLFAEVLSKEYGLTEYQAGDIMAFNDGYHDFDDDAPEWKQDRKRAEAVIQYVREYHE